MFHLLNEIVEAQKRGEPRGITSICSAHPWVLKAAMRMDSPLLIESTCNQVNQFGGYTGMTPETFAAYVHDLAVENNFPVEKLILGGDHLGPSIWQHESATSAMQKSEDLVQAYVKAGFNKIHLDASMKLGDDDPSLPLDLELVARRTARLAKIAEGSYSESVLESKLCYVIGSEVPIPGGAIEHEQGVSVTRVEDVRQMLEAMRSAFFREELEAAWERVIALVVQPGVEFGDDFVLDYNPEQAFELKRFAETIPFVYEAHSTDYQTSENLRKLVQDHFAILKVGPALTFAFREAVFALAMMENELLPPAQCSKLVQRLDETMQREPGFWIKHYRGTEQEKAIARKYSLSDRIRYYWSSPDVQAAFDLLLNNFTGQPLPYSLLSQYLPHQHVLIREGKVENLVHAIIEESVSAVLRDYFQACEPVA